MVKYTKEKIENICLTNIKNELDEIGWSQKEFAKELGVSHKVVYGWFYRGTFSPDMLAKVCTTLDIDPWVLFMEEE